MADLQEYIRTHNFPCWCGQTRSRLACKQMFGRRNFVVLRCLDCGTHRILPRALQTQASAETLYNEYEGPEVTPTREREHLDQMIDRLEAVKVDLKRGSRVLDVGCGSGLLLDGICQRCGCNGKGIDVDRRRIAKAQSRSGAAQFECGLFDPSKIDRTYDLVISSAVIEHVLNPVDFLKQLGGGLREGGGLFLLTPNAASTNYRLLQSWWRELLSIGEHIYLFTPESLAACAAKAGFELVAAASDFDPSHPRLQFNSPRNALVSTWALYCKTVKGFSRMLASSQTGDILYAHFRKRSGAAFQ